ncbi:DEAD-box ATP-dependent RNA helicase 58, chloroplastic-like isoform X3 [Camellia sinensis]|uniref:DEAD-box ATP-dependent RNA helicase 58, chloroplastic-like isoform X3 n=1 Tax=Camellia sinensis TaxID=4442 RepID=UPI00103576CC|nr:DEAD-box ATP-dependent RNA helicase 58, chloroplastic-like isoform X3 [Camellia sinensis]
MACFSANQLYSLSWRFSVKPRPQNPNCTRSWFVNRRNRTLSPLSNSNRRPSRASLDSTCVGIEADISERASTIRELCEDHIPDHILRRVEEVGFVVPTDVQRKALPIMLSGRDCILHAQTGSGKTLAYLLSIFAVVNTQRSSVQALIVVPTSELGMQVEPPTIVVATLGSLCQMIDKKILKLDSMQVLVIDEVDFMFNSSKQVSSLRKLLISYSLRNNRQTIFASASIPQHKRFLSDCIQQKWTKDDVVHVHVNPVEPMPSRLHHRFVMCGKNERHQTLLSLLRGDAPHSAIIFVSVQSEKSKKAGHAPPTTLLIDLLKTSLPGCFDILMLEEDMNFNLRAASLSVTIPFSLVSENLVVAALFVLLKMEMRQGRSYLLVATDIAARGVDLPEITHIYNFDLPKTAVDYLHRAGRTGRKPLSDNKCFVTSIITSEERFVLQRFENELMFQCTEVFL